MQDIRGISLQCGLWPFVIEMGTGVDTKTRDTTPDESAGPKDTYQLGLPVSRYRHACRSTQDLLAFLL